MKALLGIMAIAVYGGITYYIGRNLKTWMQSLDIYRWPLVFWLLLFVISLGFIIGKLHPLLTPVYVLGNYWMFVFQYGIALCIIANLLVKFTPLTTKFAGAGVFGYASDAIGCWYV